MTSIEWRKNPERTSMAREALESPVLKEMLLVLQQEHPHWIAPNISKEFEATAHLFCIRGYNLFLQQLYSLGQPLPPPPKAVESTFGQEDHNAR